MSSTSHTPASKGFIGWFRSGIRFTERLFKNFTIQIKWWWRSQKDKCSTVHAWRTRNHYHPSIEYAIGIVIILFYILVILPFILIWVLLKSI